MIGQEGPHAVHVPRVPCRPAALTVTVDTAPAPPASPAQGRGEGAGGAVYDGASHLTTGAVPLFTETERRGEREIAGAALEAVPNPSTHRDYTVELSYPEFTCKCPRTGYPDFATITLTYVPGDAICELKSFKLYLNRFRDEYIFHEAATNRILDDFVAAISPRQAEIEADWNPRGNLKTVVRASYSAAPEGYV